MELNELENERITENDIVSCIIFTEIIDDDPED